VGRFVVVGRVLDFGRRVIDSAFDSFASVIGGVANGFASAFHGGASFRSGGVGIGFGCILVSLAAGGQAERQSGGEGKSDSHRKLQ
jgi:hypothetical protein